MSKRYAHRGYVIARGDYVGFAIFARLHGRRYRSRRWYVTDPDSTTVDRRGAGFRTIAEAKQVINRRYEEDQ
jgi:hypothetical protein